VVQDGQCGGKRNPLAAPAATDSTALPETPPSASVRVIAGGGGSDEGGQQLSGSLYSVRDLLRGCSSLRTSPLYHLRGLLRVCFSLLTSDLAVRQRRSQDSTPIVPYIFADNRAQILGSHGSERTGFNAGLNPLQRLHLRIGHASKAVLLAGLKANAFRGALTTFKACKKLEIGACDACISSTMRQNTVKPSTRNLSLLKPMEEIGMDPVQLSTTAFGGENYVNFGLCYSAKLAMAYAENTEGNQVKVL
jgi:hypothetical protein